MFASLSRFFFQNQTLKQTAAKNTVWLFLGQIVGRLLRAILVIYAARVLGPEQWGAFSYVVGLVAFFLIFSDIGTSAIVTRESAKDMASGEKYFATAFLLKLLPLTASILLLLFGNRYLTNIESARMLMPLVIFLLLFDSIRNFGFTMSRATQKMELEAGNEVLTNLLVVLFGFYFLQMEPTPQHLLFGYIFGTLGGFLLTLFILRESFFRILRNFDRALVMPLLTNALPFAFASFLGAIMINTDMLMLGWLRTPAELGYYSAAQKPVQLFYVFASLFASSLFPIFSQLTQDKERFRSILEKALAAALLVAIPLALGSLVLGSHLIILLFGNEYAPATSSFQILMLTVLIISPSVIVSNALLSQNQQKRFVMFSLIGALGNVLFNFLLIPFWGIAGCAFSTLITQILANTFIWKKLAAYQPFSITRHLRHLLIAGSGMTFAIYPLEKIHTPLFVTLTIAVIIYFGLLKIQKDTILHEIIKLKL